MTTACNSRGASYVFVRDGGRWTQTAYVKASNTDAGDTFGGWSVALSGEHAGLWRSRRGQQRDGCERRPERQQRQRLR
jgi:hypothetical protein